jgi:hypothetical protein
MRRYLLTCETIDDELRLQSIVVRLKAVPHRAMIRIPIQWNGKNMDDPRSYEEAFRTLAGYSDLTIEFVDSDAAKHLTALAYQRHVEDGVAILGSYCTAAEVGNEVNCSNWTHGPHPHPPEEVVQMVQNALDVCARVRLATAITYYLSTDEKPHMVEWIKRYASGLNSQYALVSHYPNSAPIPFVDEEILRVFAEFADSVHAPVIGWGEYGIEGEHTNVGKDLPARAALIRQVERDYWQALAGIPRYSGFGGYWDCKSDEALANVFKEVWK